jgi:hypothetical protein
MDAAAAAVDEEPGLVGAEQLGRQLLRPIDHASR